MTIQTIIKRAIKRVELEDKVLTPDNYAESFCKEAKKAGSLTQDCNHVANFIQTLSKEMQKEMQSYKITTMVELSRFLVGKLNRLETGKPKEDNTLANIKIASLIISSFVPSVSLEVDKKIDILRKKLRKNPKIMQNTSFEKDVNAIIDQRISLDKQSVKNMVESLDDVLSKLSSRVLNMIERSDKSTTEIKEIKQQLESYTESSSKNIDQTYEKLHTIASALEENTHVLSKDLTVHKSYVDVLSVQLHKLEKELEEAKKDSKEDFLTKLYNKRALDEFMKMKEGEFERYDRNYSVVMFDIDFFKKVNDDYGHDAGDAILTAFAKILKNDARTVDVVGRFGGEEFMALLSETDSKGATIFANKVREHVQTAHFMYKGERIELTVSAGVGERVHNISLLGLVTSADQNLYKAKENGRNRVES